MVDRTDMGPGTHSLALLQSSRSKAALAVAALAVVAAGCGSAGGARPAGEGAGHVASSGQVESPQASRGAREVVARGLAAVGGAGAVERVGGLVVEGEGTYDLGVRLQGMRPGPGDRYPVRERLGVLPAEGRTVYESHGRINPDADEWLRHDLRADHGYWIDLLSRRAFRGGTGGRARYERVVPHLLLEEALGREASLRSAGRTRVDGEARDAVVYETADGVPLTLLFDPEGGLLREVEYAADLPLRGDARVRWRFGEYRPVPGLGRYPSSYVIELDGEVLRDVTFTQVRAGRDSDLFHVPPDIALPSPPPPAAPAASAAADSNGDDAPEAEPAPDPFDIRELVPGVHLFVNLRGGFHMLFVEFADHVLAVDAPAGWNELHQLPPAGVGSGRAALSERYLEGIRATVPGKPVRYVVVTHAHSDHAGGVEAFVRAGATVLGSAETRDAVERLVGRDPGPGGGAGSALRFETVRDERVLRDDAMEVRVLDVGPNPHAAGMLAVHLPRQGLLYVSDLFDPASPANFPSPARVPVMRWFVDWLDRAGLEPDLIYAVHGSARVTEAQLEEIRAIPASR